VVTITLVSCKTVGDEQRLDSFGSQHVASVVRRKFTNSGFEKRRKGEILESMSTSGQTWGDLRCSFDIPIRWRTGIRIHPIAGDPEINNFRREAAVETKVINTLFIQSQDSPGTYVAVSCVCMQVWMSSTPVFQSLFPFSESSSGLGGTETGCMRAPVRVAPSMREPPRKQTRWSCFGVNRQVLYESGIK
jgi:hypothetical protein